VTTPPPAGRPSVEDVARWIRARTKDDQMNEVGTFDSATRPTDTQVDEQITVSMAIIQPSLPSLDKLPADLLPSVAAVVSLDAACSIEKAYWPEQISTDRSNYSVLWTQREEALAALVAAASAAVGGSEYEMPGITMIPVGSWTSIAPRDGWAPIP